MIAGLGTTELLTILAIVVLIFGVGRISKLGSELGSGIRAFRQGAREEVAARVKEQSDV